MATKHFEMNHTMLSCGISSLETLIQTACSLENREADYEIYEPALTTKICFDASKRKSLKSFEMLNRSPPGSTLSLRGILTPRASGARIVGLA